MVPSDLDAPLEALAPGSTLRSVRGGGSDPEASILQNTTPAHRRRADPSRRRTGRSGALVWRSPERHLWVATDDGEFAGMTVYDRRGYVATGPTAVPVGRYRSLEAAQAALESRV